MLIQGAGRIVAGAGHLGHLQAEQAVLADLLAGGIQKQLLALGELAFFTILNGH